MRKDFKARQRDKDYTDYDGLVVAAIMLLLVLFLCLAYKKLGVSSGQDYANLAVPNNQDKMETYKDFMSLR